MSRIILFVVTVIALGIGCDESNLLVENDTPVRVSGLVVAAICLPTNQVEPYTIEYQHYADLRFIREDGKTYFAQTDDSSVYAVSLDTGMYSIILETGHTYPDTARDIRFVRDTVYNVLVKLDYLSADTLNLSFFYRNKSDSLGQSLEMQLLTTLNNHLDSVLLLSEANRVVNNSININKLFVNYRVPVRGGLQLWYVSKSIDFLIDRGIVVAPESFSAHPDVIGCPAE